MANPRGQQRDKPFRDALRMEAIALANGEVNLHPPGSLRWNAQQLLKKGEPTAIKELADRLDGKVPQGIIGGDDDDNPVQLALIERCIVDPTDTNSAGVQAPVGAKPV